MPSDDLLRRVPAVKRPQEQRFCESESCFVVIRLLYDDSLEDRVRVASTEFEGIQRLDNALTSTSPAAHLTTLSKDN
jgi:hypothetical protein